MGGKVIGLTQFQRNIAKAPLKIGHANREAVEQIGQLARVALLASGAAATGGDLQFSRFGRGDHRGIVPLGVSFRVVGPGKYGGAGTVIHPTIPGPWYLAEFGSYGKRFAITPGNIGKVRGRKTKAARRAAKQQLYEHLFGGGNVGFMGNVGRGFAASGVVYHPPVAGKRAWSVGAKTVKRVGPAVWRRQQLRALRAVWGG